MHGKGLSPSGKAKDFDSFIPPVRIRSALFYLSRGQFPAEINVLTKKKRKIDFAVDILLSKGYNALVVVIGLSPNGKATDSDSVIVKVRILLAQRLTGIPVGIPVSFYLSGT